MSLTVALSTLRTNIRNRGEFRDKYITDAELTAMVNAALKELHWKIHALNQDYYADFKAYNVIATPESGTGDSLAVSSGVVTLTDAGAAFNVNIPDCMITISGASNAANNGRFPIISRTSGTALTFTNANGVNETSSFSYQIETNRFSLPSDFWQANGCDILDDAGLWANMRRFNWGDRNRLQGTTSVRLGLRYRIQANTLLVAPTPGWSATGGLRLWYVPTPTVLSADGDTWDTVAGFDEWIVLACCIMCCAKEGTDASLFAAQLGKCEAMIASVVGKRDVGEGDTIRDVYEERNDLIDEPTYWRP